MDVVTATKTDTDCEVHVITITKFANWSNSTDLYDRSCIQSFIETHIRPTIQVLQSWEATLFSIAYATIITVGLAGNGLVIGVVLSKREMRTNRNVFIMNLAISNFILALILYPFLWLPAVEILFPYGPVFCKIVNAFPGSNIYCSTLTIAVMAVDRFYAVAQSMSSRRDLLPKRTTGFAITLALAVWVISIALSIPLLILYETALSPGGLVDLRLYPNGTETFAWPVCQFAPTYNAEDVASIKIAVSLVQFSFLYLLPLIVLTLFNWKLTRFLNRHALRSLVVVPRFRNVDSVENSLPEMVVGRAAVASQRRRNRTTSLLIAMAASYAILWLPFTIFTLLDDFKVLSKHYSYSELKRVDFAAKLISMLSICINPFLYGYLNTNFNRAFKEIFSYLPCFRPDMDIPTGDRMNLPRMSGVSLLSRMGTRLSLITDHMNNNQSSVDSPKTPRQQRSPLSQYRQKNSAFGLKKERRAWKCPANGKYVPEETEPLRDKTKTENGDPFFYKNSDANETFL